MALVQHALSSPALMVRSAHEIFRIVRLLLSDVELWAQGARARDEYGNNVRPNDARACCWSLNGALAVASNTMGITPPCLLEFLDLLLREYNMVKVLYEEGGQQLWETCDDFNDFRPHSSVLALLDEAIRRTATI